MRNKQFMRDLRLSQYPDYYSSRMRSVTATRPHRSAIEYLWATVVVGFGGLWVYIITWGWL